jgi:RNA polymerase sigma factor (sigma-70 family)
MAATDGELLSAVAMGGATRAEAWRELVARHTPKLYAVARSFGLDQQTCADLVQTAWLRLVERHDQLNQPESLGPWLGTVVRNEARRLVTRRRTVAVDDGWDRLPDERAAPPDDRLIAGERARAVRAAFSRLGDDCRQLLRLLTSDPPLAYADIATAIGRPIGAIGPTRQRCLASLRRLLPAGVEP